MVGVGQESRTGRRAAYEFMRIEARDGVVAFTATLEGQPPTAFPLLSSGDGEVVFENKAHDFPQRVRYRNDGKDALFARVEGTQKGEDFPYRRVACP